MDTNDYNAIEEIRSQLNMTPGEAMQFYYLRLGGDINKWKGRNKQQIRRGIPELFPMIFLMLGLFIQSFSRAFEQQPAISWAIVLSGMLLYVLFNKWFLYELRLETKK
jgi:hypothetical protein